ncbi:MAG TPA: GGDEF domain-containing protein [Bauldia sp.]|nr:GGDEF domain-containing protein [Bauldia sp.]
MQLDLPTLMVAGSFVTAISGVFLFFAWLQNRAAVGMLWWAAGNLTLAMAVPLVASRNPVFGVPSTVLGILLLNVSPALIWAAARSCNGRRPQISSVAAGAFVWLLAFALPDIRQSPQTQMALNLAVAAFYFFAASSEFWRGRDERLQSRWPLIVLLFLHGLFFLTGTVESANGDLPTFGPPTLGSWFGLIQFETLFFVVGTAIFAVAMAKERTEQQYMAAARIDSLTGVASRGALMEAAHSLLDRCARDNSDFSVIVFDLDWFKQVNDTFGHGAGDRVLKSFADLARRSLRATDFIGRPGGEEFVVLLPGSAKAAAYVVAERIRSAFAEASREIDGRPLNATVSAGVATASGLSTVDTLMVAADRALYKAKAEGRNRVEVAERWVAEPAIPAMASEAA